MLRTLLLCGGRSSRYGADKLLVKVAHEGRRVPMAELAARHAIEGTGGALAVIPPEAAALRKLLAGAGCEILETADTARGLGASLAAGISAASQAQGWIVALGDMPFIAPSTFAAVQAALRGGALVVAPVRENTSERGHPVGFAAALRDELVALDGDEGARSVIQRHADRLVTIAVADPGIAIDIDTPGDLDASAAR